MLVGIIGDATVRVKVGSPLGHRSRLDYEVRLCPVIASLERAPVTLPPAPSLHVIDSLFPPPMRAVNAMVCLSSDAALTVTDRAGAVTD